MLFYVFDSIRGSARTNSYSWRPRFVKDLGFILLLSGWITCMTCPEESYADLAPLTPTPGSTHNSAEGMLTWRASGRNLIVNGDFESGNFTGWTKRRSSYPDIALNRLDHNLMPARGSQAVYSGQVCAVFSSSSIGSQALVQQVELPSECTGLRLSWADRISNRASNFNSYNQKFVVEIRSSDTQVLDHRSVSEVLEVVYSTHPDDSLRGEWVRRTADLSAYKGRTIYLAFVKVAYAGYMEVNLDDVRLEVTTADGPAFEVFLGSTTNLNATHRLGGTSQLSISYADLVPQQRYYWQVMSKENSEIEWSPVGEFTVGSCGTFDHFSWDHPPSQWFQGIPFAARIKAKDLYGHTISNYTGKISVAALAEAARPATVLITELMASSGARIELMNWSDKTVSLRGWQVFIYDENSWPEPRPVFKFPSHVSLLKDRPIVLSWGTNHPTSTNFFSLAYDLSWDFTKTNSLAAVLLCDARFNPVDFICVGKAFPGQISNPMTIPLSEWYGPPVESVSPRGSSIQRWDETDHQNGNDWAASSPSMGHMHSRCGREYPRRWGEIQSSAQSLTDFTNGIGSGWIALLQESSNRVYLIADDRAGHWGLSYPTRIAARPTLDLILPQVMVESRENSVQTGSIQLPYAISNHLAVTLVDQPSGLISIPSLIEIPAGQTKMPFALRVIDDAVLNGPRVVQLSAHAPGYADVTRALTVGDDEVAVLSLEIPARAREGVGSLHGALSVDRALDRDCPVTLTVTDPSSILAPAQVILPTGTTKADFTFSVADNDRIEADKVVTFTATVADWPEARAQIQVVNDDEAVLRLTMPSSLAAFDNTNYSGGQVSIPGVLPYSLVVNLEALPSHELKIPSSVTIPFGLTNAFFYVAPPSLIQNPGIRMLEAVASAPGFATSHALVAMADDIDRTIELTINHLVYSRNSRRLFAAVPASAPNPSNMIAVINPMEAKIESHIPLLQSPGSMAITDDGTYLYVCLDGGKVIQPIRLDTRLLEPAISLGGRSCIQLAAVPGRPNQLMVLSCQVASDSNSYWLQLYENGRPLSNTISNIRTFVNSEEPDHWIAVRTFKSSSRSEFVEIVANPNGLQALRNAPFTFSPWASESITPWMKAGNRIYSAEGRVIDINTFSELSRVPGATGKYMAIDAEHSRAYFLGDSIIDNMAIEISEVDLESRLVGRMIPISAGNNYHSLIRWGHDGLAFVMGNQLHLLRTSLIPGNARADLACSFLVDSPIFSVGSNYLVTTVVSNAGPDWATSVQLQGVLPASFTVVSAQASQGTVTSTYHQISGQLGHLAPGAVLTLSLTVQPQAAGIFSFRPVVRADQNENQYANNQGEVELAVQFPNLPNTENQLLLSTSDILYDPHRQRLYATVPSHAGHGANSLVEIDPANGAIEDRWPMSSSPGKIARSDDGEFLYIALNEQGIILPFHLPTRRARTPFAWGLKFTNSAWRVRELKVLPHQPDSLVISFAPLVGNTNLDTMVLYRAGQPLKMVYRGGTVIHFSSDGSIIYTIDAPKPNQPLNLVLLKSTAQGLEPISSVTNLLASSNLQVVGSYLYSGSGQIINLDTMRQELQCENLGSDCQVLAFPEGGRLFFLDGSNSGACSFKVYDGESGKFLDLLSKEYSNQRSDLVLLQCGPDRLLYRYNPDCLHILRTPMIPNGPPADLRVEWIPEFPVVTHSPCVFQVKITNTSTNSANHVQFILDSSSWILKVEVSQGAFTNTQQTAHGFLGTLLPGQSALATFATQSETACFFSPGFRVFASSEKNTKDNYSSPLIRICAGLSNNSDGQFIFPNSAMVYSPRLRLFYVSLPASLAGPILGDSIIALEPITGWFSLPLAVGKEPRQLVVSADGHHLYVYLEGENALQSVDLDRWILDTRYSLSEGPAVSDLVANPVQADQLLFTRHGSIHVLEKGGIRILPSPEIDGRPIQAFWMAFSEDGSRLAVAENNPPYVIQPAMAILTVSNSIFTPRLASDTATSSGRIHFVSNRVFQGMGFVRNADTLQLEKEFFVQGITCDVVPLIEADRLFYLSGSCPVSVRCFEWTTQHELDRRASGLMYMPGSQPCFTSWGANGLAWRDGNRVFLIRHPMIPLRVDADTDTDRIPDEWEQSHFLDPSWPDDALLDIDGDGYNNYQEFVVGSDLFDPDSVFHIDRARLSNGNMIITFNSVKGSSYLLETRMGLNDEHWTPAGPPLVGTGDMAHFEIAVPSGQSQFYRVAVHRGEP